MKEKYIGTGRKNQKLKTRDKILESTQSLMENKENLTLEDVAKKAGISRATIYRYYTSIDILAAEAILDLNTKTSEEIIEEIKDQNLTEAILAIQDYYNDLTIEYEAGFRKYMSVVINAPKNKKIRGARRKKTLMMILQEKAPNMDTNRMEEIANMATLWMGVEAFVVTKDVCGLNNKNSKALLKRGLKMFLETFIR